MQSFFNKLLIICSSALICFSPYLSEASNTLTSSDGNWTNATGGPVFGLGSSQIYWGIPVYEDAGINGLSSYLYKPTTTPLNVALGERFAIGQFTHYNRLIYGQSPTSTKLQLELSLNVGGTSIDDIIFDTTFNHSETGNSGSGGCCDDLVGINLGTNSAYEFTKNHIKYRLELLGFYINNSLVDSFVTPENSDGIADILAVLSAENLPDKPIGPPINPPTVINPEPETYLILGGALLFILLKRNGKRRKNQKTKLAFVEKESPTFFLGRFWKR